MPMSTSTILRNTVAPNFMRHLLWSLEEAHVTIIIYRLSINIYCYTRSNESAGCARQGAARRYSRLMRPLRYSINVTLDGCCDHRAIPADEELHRHAIENFDRADALLFGRVIYEMMEAAFRPSAR